MRDKLLATGDALLCQAYDRDAFYAVGMTEEKLREWARENEGKILKVLILRIKLKIKIQVSKNRHVGYGIRYACTRNAKARDNCPYLLIHIPGKFYLIHN